MKRIMLGLASVLFVFIFSHSMWACDVCGCSVSGQQFGILPQFQKHFIGLRYGYRQFKSVHPPLFSTDSEVTSFEYFHNTDLWGRIVVSKRIQLFVFVPFQSVTKKENNLLTKNSGVGDVSLNILYSLINQRKADDSDIVQHLQFGGGIKVPTGNSSYITDEHEWIPGIQLGTGSIDFNTNINYLIRNSTLGVSLEGSYRKNGLNKSFKFSNGSRISSSIRTFYIINQKNWKILPSAGLQFEHASKDTHFGSELDLSGGNSLFAQFGVDFYSDRYAIGINLQPVLFQDVAQGNLTSATRLNAQFSVLF